MASTVGPAAALALIRRRNFGPYFAGNAAALILFVTGRRGTSSADPVRT